MEQTPPYAPGDEFEFMGFRMRCLADKARIGDSGDYVDAVAAMYVDGTGCLKSIAFLPREYAGLRAGSRFLRYGLDDGGLEIA